MRSYAAQQWGQSISLANPALDGGFGLKLAFSPIFHMSTELLLKALGVLLIFAVVGIPGLTHRLSYTSTRVGHSGLLCVPVAGLFTLP